MTELDAAEIRALRRRARLATLDALRALGGEARRRDILAHAATHGGFAPRERDAPPPASSGGKHASRLEHELAWTLTNLKRDGLVRNPARGVWELAGQAARTEPPLAAPVVASRLQRLRAMPYREYLRSPEWRETRAAALVRAGHACSLDATHTDRLEVHHRTYARLGEERPEDVVVLCADCHRHHHQLTGRPRRPDRTATSVAPPQAARDQPPHAGSPRRRDEPSSMEPARAARDEPPQGGPPQTPDEPAPARAPRRRWWRPSR